MSRVRIHRLHSGSERSRSNEDALKKKSEGYGVLDTQKEVNKAKGR